ncbi:hypothetical protein CFC21_008923 [Triticum aestivum]|uniref:Cell number regulator 2-like n=3 Tax=Triticum TaxID=4564 RepID=A0A9R0R5I2_TRITD|nr:cell number regulator 2-like [Triticum dicoccoides]KAF6991874.1 hypothetical protein CFC21_008923 [Triticum aestivum]VAH22722.1 unnamed protein product [Triticum turgidum subsp. durum]
MYPKPEDGPATGFPMSGGTARTGGGPGAYYQAAPATAAFAMQAAQAPLAAWSTGLCDCFDDCGNCCITCLCPCITFGQVAEIIDRGSTSCGASGALYALIMLLTGCQCVYSCFYRAKMRAHYGLQESPCADCCIHWCCEPCALCQEYRELKKRGFDMNLGWHANMERQGRTPATMPPLMHPGMTR